GTTAGFTTTGTGGTWTTTNALVASVDGSGTVTALASGSVVVSYTAATACSTAVATFPLTVNPAATAGTLSGASSVCVGATSSIASTVTGGTWTTADAAIASVNSATGAVTGVAAGTTTITYTATNSCGTAIATRTITVNPLAVPGTISGTTNVCIGATTNLSSSGTGGAWSSSDATIATVSNTGVVTGRAAGTAIISYAVTNGCGTVAATTTVNVMPFPSAGTITGPGTACIGTPVTYIDTTAGGVWSSGDNSIATVNTTGTVTGVTAGTVNIYYTVTNMCGATNVTISVNVINPPATSVITGLTTICPGGSTTLTDTLPGGVWSSSDNSIATVAATSSSTAGVTGVATGTAIISYTISNACGVSVATAYVTVAPLPSATISAPASLCPGNTATLVPSVTGGTWAVTDSTMGSISAAGVFTALRTGTAVVAYRLTGTCGTSIINDTIIISPVTNAGTITGYPAACIGTTTTLSDSITGGSWSSSNTSVATISNTGVITGIAAGATTITYAVSGSCGTAYATQTVVIYSAPDPGFITGVTTLCAGAVDTFRETISGGTWSSSNAAVATVAATGSSSAAVTGVSGGTAIISYSVTGLCGTAIATAFVTINPGAPTGTIAGTTTLCTGATTTLTDSVSGGVWSVADTSVATI
ncbi:MAG: hypothetical protein EBZ77_12735, partial [Chitinophagia bacterium]|nr:hypothetical protein [Chitinophagia bacterium]